MLKSFKTEVNPTVEQKIKINKTIGTCRYVYNFYLGHNKTLYDNGEKFMTGKSFSVLLNNEYIPNNPDKIWIKEAYSKAVKNYIEADSPQKVAQNYLNAASIMLEYKNEEKAKNLLEKATKYAEKTNNESLMKEISNTLISIS